MTRAILRKLDRDELREVAQHSADAGWSGFTYTADTVAFYKAHKADILELAKQMASDMGVDMLELIRGFGCLQYTNPFGKRVPSFELSEIAEAIHSGRGNDADTIRNAMAWFALEEVARELNPDI